MFVTQIVFQFDVISSIENLFSFLCTFQSNFSFFTVSFTSQANFKRTFFYRPHVKENRIFQSNNYEICYMQICITLIVSQTTSNMKLLLYKFKLPFQSRKHFLKQKKT